jgi:hypothetical protein
MYILIIAYSAYFRFLFEFLFGHVREQRQTMGERCCGEGSAKHGDALTPGALHHMGPTTGMYLQDAIEFGLLASEVSALSFGG